jgi:DNA-directed RNA polymerase specialized sigma24 family protein
MKKDIPSPSAIRIDEETKRFLQKRAKTLRLSEYRYVKMLIHQDAGLHVAHPSGRLKKTIKDLYRDVFTTDPHEDDEKKLLRAVYRLKDHQRQFVLQYYKESLTYDQIGQRNGLDKECIRKIIQRARIILKHGRGIHSPKINKELQM